MTPERWEQIDKLLEQALEQEPGNRKLFLDGACVGDDELRREVETLLAAHTRGGLLSSPALAVASQKPADSPQSFIGQRLRHYQILSRLGEGGMGIVYKARDQHLDRFVAIKVLPPELVADPDRKRRFVQEAKAASALNHPNIITIHDIANDNGTDFIVMEYVQGKTLGQLIPRRGMKLSEVLKYGIQISDALAKAHAAGIIHRDLKPGNIMVRESGLVKVLDFGLAKLTERPQLGEDESTRSIPPWTQEGTILGTASYMSPEQVAGKSVDARSDIFSFGSVLYEMVTGQRAFQGDSKMSILAAVLNQEPKPASEISRPLPRDLEKIITRCLRKDLSRRWQTMADLRIALQELKEELASGSLGAEGVVAPRRVSPLQWAAAVVMVISLAAAAWFWLSRSDTRQPEVSLRAVPLTTYPGWERSPSFSPDGNQVAFAWAKTGRDEHADIYIKQIGVEEPFRLTDDPRSDLNPAWSPDGRTIAFARYLLPERIAYIVKPQRGGPERTIAEFDLPTAFVRSRAGVFFTPKCAWTPESKLLIVVGTNAQQELPALFLVSLENDEKRKLTDPPSRFADTDPAVSPDGRALVFSRIDQNGRCDLMRLGLSEDLTPQGRPERLTFDNPINRHPAWTADGREIAFVSGTTGDQSLWKLTASKSADSTRLAFAGLDNPAISRHGKRLAYDAQKGDQDIWRLEVPGQGNEPKGAVKFIASTWTEGGPTFSPDGKTIAFSSTRSGSSEIWTCDSDGSHLVQLTWFGGPITQRPRWSPDGQLIAFYSDAKGNRDIYVIRADGGIPKHLTTDPSTDTNPDWSADGKRVYFHSDRTGQKKIWKVPVDGGEAVPVWEIHGSQPVESPDGVFLYHDKGWPDLYSVWRVPTSGGTETQVIDSLPPEGNWVVVREGIYFISKPNDNGISYIRFKDPTTRSVRTVAPIKGRVSNGFTVSPDRRTFLYTLSGEAGSDLMLVENFR